MNKILNWFTLNKIMLFSSIMLFFYLISLGYKTLNLPSDYINFCCLDDRKLNLFLISIPLFIFTAISFHTKQNTFNVWRKNTLFYIIIYLFLYFIVPTQSNGYIWLQRETVSFFGSIFYFIFSLFIIISQSLKK